MQRSHPVGFGRTESPFPGGRLIIMILSSWSVITPPLTAAYPRLPPCVVHVPILSLALILLVRAAVLALACLNRQPHALLLSVWHRDRIVTASCVRGRSSTAS